MISKTNPVKIFDSIDTCNGCQYLRSVESNYINERYAWTKECGFYNADTSIGEETAWNTIRSTNVCWADNFRICFEI